VNLFQCCSILHIAVTLIRSMVNAMCEILQLLQHMNYELVDSKYSLNLMPSHTARYYFHSIFNYYVLLFSHNFLSL